MKYCFITALHYLSLDKQEISIQIPGGIVSNKQNTLATLFDNSLSAYSLGAHSIDEIRQSTYYYSKGESDYAATESDAAWNSFAFALMRQAQIFTDQLWYIKDNSVYVFEGFLYVYRSRLEDGCTYKASLARINSLANTKRESLVFSKEELETAAKGMTLVIKGGLPVSDQNYKEATQHQYYREFCLSRKDTAEMYISMARWGGAAPMKLMMYCAAMEALVITEDRKIKETVSRRISFLLGKTEEERKQYYEEIRQCYSIRSSVAHGDFVEGKMEETTSFTVKIDGYLRTLMKLELPYTLSDKEIDGYFEKA